MEYFDSFGMPTLIAWELEMRKTGKKTFLHNADQIQALDSVRCGWYCLSFMNERNKGVSFENILERFSPDVRENERVVKNYF